MTSQKVLLLVVIMFIQRFLCLLLLLCTTSAQAGYTHYWTWKTPPDSARLKKCIDEMKIIASKRSTNRPKDVYGWMTLRLMRLPENDDLETRHNRGYWSVG